MKTLYVIVYWTTRVVIIVIKVILFMALCLAGGIILNDIINHFAGE